MYDKRAYGEFGWKFVHAGELYRSIKNLPADLQLEMCGIFKQATMGDCDVPECTDKTATVIENQMREQWLKHKGLDEIEAMQKYIDRANELAQQFADQIDTTK